MKEENKEKQQRKQRSKNGEAGQKMLSFRLDQGLIKWLAKQANKGRYINDLIYRDMTKYYREKRDEEEPDDDLTTLITDYQP